MFRAEQDVITGSWLVAVIGAGAVLVGPITPWMGPVEIVGLVLCVIGTLALVASFLRD
jgi:hypothetical protein